MNRNSPHICACGNEIFKSSGTSIWPKRCIKCQQAIDSKKRIENNKKLMSQSSFNTKLDRKSKEKGKSTTPRKKSPKSKKSSIEKQMDDAWSKLVKLKAGMKCEVCGKTKNLNSHHIFSRAKKSVRWKTTNGICLCVGHHIGNEFSPHKTSVTFTPWLIKYKGAKFIQDLTIASNATSHYCQFEKELILKELQNEIINYNG